MGSYWGWDNAEACRADFVEDCGDPFGLYGPPEADFDKCSREIGDANAVVLNSADGPGRYLELGGWPCLYAQ